jgi:hypothetical protein
MDRSFCPDGLATDGLMLYEGDFRPGSCEVNLGAFLGTYICLVIFRWMLCAAQFKLWKDRERRYFEKTKKVRRRLPVLPLLSILSSSILTIFVALTSTNVANSRNGAPGFLLAMFYIPLEAQVLMNMIRIVNLGKKLIPMSRATVDGSYVASSPRLDDLGNATALQKVLFVLYVLGMMLTVASGIASLVAHVYVPFQVLIMTLMLNGFLLSIILGVQYQRVINAVQDMHRAARNLVVNKDKAHDIEAAIQKLRFQQLAAVVLGSLTSIMWILNVTRVVLPQWW